MICLPASSQETDRKKPRFSAGVQYTQEFLVDGYVRVREWELAGDKMYLEDLGMKDYPALQFHAEMTLPNDGAVKLTYDQHFLRGSAVLNRDIYYNGTIIDGRNGIDISPTTYYRITASWTGKLIQRNGLDVRYIGGLVFDYIIFYLDGKVPAASPRNEVYERFSRQALPYPFIGAAASQKVGEKGRLWLETSGTYIPKFKSFYNEGGKVHLQYSNFLADLKYSVKLRQFLLGAGGKVHHMRLFQESEEDSNDLWMFTGGPYIQVICHL